MRGEERKEPTDTHHKNEKLKIYPSDISEKLKFYPFRHLFSGLFIVSEEVS